MSHLQIVTFYIEFEYLVKLIYKLCQNSHLLNFCLVPVPIVIPCKLVLLSYIYL